MVLKFLGLGKKSEYFLEAPPTETNGAQPPAQAEPAPATPEHIQMEAPASAPAQSEAPAVAPVEAAEAAATPTETPTEAPAKPKAKKLKKTKSAEAAAPATEAAPAPKAAPVAPQPEPAKTFATDFLLPSNTPRRRPGPSLDMFRTMAKDVKPRK
ncbi:MAG: hypothetical protein IGS50_00695 [Synechococcales cyanobacterium C42_A2020_086]|jgi:hypothetical protein|nr:hypothetical protein [Synechococcales cyanobacterium C42_A2020_086]